MIPISPTPGERSSRPAFEGRLSARWGDSTSTGGSDVTIGDGGGEIGIGVHHGWVAVGDGPLQNSNAVTADWRISFTPRVELRGEWYAGRLVRGLGGGGINQAFGKPIGNEPLGPPINDRAGWGQLNAQFLSTLLGGAGCGLDVVDLADRPVRTRNTVCATYVLLAPLGAVLRRPRVARRRDQVRHGRDGARPAAQPRAWF